MHAQKGLYAEPGPYPVIRDNQCNEVGKITQGGGAILNGDGTSGSDDAKLLKAIQDSLKNLLDVKDAKNSLFQVIKSRLGSVGAISLTAADVEPPKFGDDKLNRLAAELNEALGG